MADLVRRRHQSADATQDERRGRRHRGDDEEGPVVEQRRAAEGEYRDLRMESAHAASSLVAAAP